MTLAKRLKIQAAIVATLLVLGACGDESVSPDTAAPDTAAPDTAVADPTAPENSGDLVVVVTTTILGDLVKALVGEDGTVEVLLPVGADPHDIQLSSQDGVKIRTADLVVANGLGLEESLITIFESAREDGARILEVGELVDPMEWGEGRDDHDHDEDDHMDDDDDHDHDEDDHMDDDDDHDHDEDDHMDEDDDHDHDHDHDEDDHDEDDDHDHDHDEDDHMDEDDDHDHDEDDHMDEDDDHDHDEDDHMDEDDDHDHDEDDHMDEDDDHDHDHDEDDHDEDDDHDHDHDHDEDDHMDEDDDHDHDEDDHMDEDDDHDHDEDDHMDEDDDHDHDEDDHMDEDDDHDHDEDDHMDEDDDHDHDEDDHMDEDDDHGHDEDDHGHAHTGAFDPHFWFDPSRVQAAVRVIADELIDIGKGVSAAEWTERADNYIAEIQAATEEAGQILSAVPESRRKLVTNHDSFSYFGAFFDFEILDTILSGGTTLARPGTAHLAELVEAIREEGVPAIFTETTADDTLPKTVAAEFDPPLLVVELYTGSLGEAGSDAETYPKWLVTNARLIAEALTP